MAKVLPFNGFYTGNSKKNSARTCVNFMPIPHDSGALSEYTLESTVGIGSPISGQYTGYRTSVNPIDSQVVNWGGSDNVFGEGVFTVTGNGILIGTNGTNLSFYDMYRPVEASFARYRISTSSESMLIILEGDTTSLVHSYTGGATVTTTDISGVSTDPVIPSDTAFFGGRFLIMSGANSNNENHRRVYYSDILAPADYDPLGFFSSVEQDSINKGIHVLNNRLYLFSDSEFTVWTSTPDVNLPFIQQKGSGGAVGIIEPSAKCEVADTLYFIGRGEGSIGFFALSGGSAQRISTPEIDQSLIGNDVFVDSRCFSFTDESGIYVAFSILDLTYCLNTTSGDYHKRSTNGGRWSVTGTGGTTEKFSITGSGYSNSQVFIGSKCSLTNTGGPVIIEADIALSNNKIGTEFGHQVNRECVTSPFNSDGITNNVRELTFQTDIDYTNFDPGLEHPKLGLSVSKDFGNSYETEMFREFENIGEIDRLLRFMNIGFFRQAFVFKIQTNNPYPHKILRMLTRLKKGIRQI